MTQNSKNVNSLFNQAIGRSAEPEIDPDVKEYVDDSIDAAVEEVTTAYTAAIASAVSDITTAYTAAIATALSTALAAIPVTIVTPQTTTVTLDPVPVTYEFGEAAELTLTVTSTSLYHFSFSCPSAAATVLTINGITGTTGDNILEADCYYEVDIWNGIAYYKKIEVETVT